MQPSFLCMCSFFCACAPSLIVRRPVWSCSARPRVWTALRPCNKIKRVRASFHAAYTILALPCILLLIRPVSCNSPCLQERSPFAPSLYPLCPLLTLSLRTPTCSPHPWRTPAPGLCPLRPLLTLPLALALQPPPSASPCPWPLPPLPPPLAQAPPPPL